MASVLRNFSLLPWFRPLPSAVTRDVRAAKVVKRRDTSKGSGSDDFPERGIPVGPLVPPAESCSAAENKGHACSREITCYSPAYRSNEYGFRRLI